MKVPPISALIVTHLGAKGRAAYKLAQSAARAIRAPRRELAEQMVELLVLDRLADGRSPSTFDQLAMRLNLRSPDAVAERLAPEEIASTLGELATHSSGSIRFNSLDRTARFIDHPLGAPEVEAFNAAINLLRRFDASLDQVVDIHELKVAEAHLHDALTGALESAARNRDILRHAARMAGSSPTPQQEQIFADFIGVLEGGPAALFAAAADAAHKARVEQAVRDYDLLATLAAATNRIRTMREYLEATGVVGDIEDNPNRDPALVKLETECKMIVVAIEAAPQVKTTSALDALESRFQRFKWTYVPFYRAAHESWCQEMEAAARLVENGRRDLTALERLDVIAALGSPDARDLAARFDHVARGVTRCELEGALAPEIMPCCPDCAFVIGTPSPRESLAELTRIIRHALEAKLARLSQSAIARLIQTHDHSHRLEGFLKITQAAQADALISVLDDKLAHYLARLLDENFGSEAVEPPLTPVMRPLRAARSGLRSQRRGKLPPDDRI